MRIWILLLALPLCSARGASLTLLGQAAEPASTVAVTPAAPAPDVDVETMLRALGMLEGGRSLQAALVALRYSHTYSVHREAGVTDQDREWIAQDYAQLQEALARYPDQPTISRSSPQFQGWVTEAAGRLVHVPAAQRARLVRSLLEVETSQQHWIDNVPVQSKRGATGFAQLLAATAASVGANRFDPRENLCGAMSYLDDLIKQHGLSGALAFYNGGDNATRRKFAYARAVSRGTRRR